MNLSSIHHKNIVKFYGVCKESENPRLWLIMEYMDVRLRDILDKLKPQEQIHVAISVAKGM